ncbi:MAG TPA: response regulator [Chloroflexota bacterium]|jgi:DNA-binding response OmpR family regulator
MLQILLVDDEPRVARALEFALKGSEMALTSISDPDLLEDSLLTVHPDAVLLDIGIGAHDGLAVCKRIKQDSRFAGIPVLLLSGQTGADTKAAGFAAGADDFVAKPFAPTELIARVQTQIARRTSA